MFARRHRNRVSVGRSAKHGSVRMQWARRTIANTGRHACCRVPTIINRRTGRRHDGETPNKNRACERSMQMSE
ncbi:hypothetical protein PENSPDRAFT_192322 [Peniophora sp. CONT]|nr:hypothetical protein PENSPDRAFT_192322 [Peniophora sp. CONT]